MKHVVLDYIKGEIVELTPVSVVVEVGGLGYIANISLNTYSALTTSKVCLLFIYEAIREDACQLFGFFDKCERELFLHLISVSSVGVNTARMILSSLAVCELKAIIASGDASALKAIKGIGSKTAERILVDLKDKIKASEIPERGSTVVEMHSEVVREAVSALVMLGFNQLVSQKVVNKIINGNPELKVEQVIKNALKMF